MGLCFCCARKCGVDRETQTGFCGMNARPVVARAGLHMWEEPCISGTNGSGAVFFSGCNLKCVFCQNYAISTGNAGKTVTVERLREIYRELAAQGAHNINLVTPSHFADAVLESLTPAPPVPVVYNTNGYESVDSLRRFEGKVQIYLPDVKYSDDSLAVRCSRAPDYFRIAKESVLEMFRQTGPYRMNAETGLLESGVVIRHLVLPGQMENTFGVIDWVRDAFKPGDVLFSLMRQYVPCGRAADFPDLNRKLTEEEYQAAEDYLFSTDIEDGFVQEGEAASESFIPAFDGSGV